jgi:hypothetical protein
MEALNAAVLPIEIYFFGKRFADWPLRWSRTRDCTKPEKVNSDQNSYGSGRLFKCQYSHIVACSIVAC